MWRLKSEFTPLLSRKYIIQIQYIFKGSSEDWNPYSLVGRYTYIEIWIHFFVIHIIHMQYSLRGLSKDWNSDSPLCYLVWWCHETEIWIYPFVITYTHNTHTIQPQGFVWRMKYGFILMISHIHIIDIQYSFRGLSGDWNLNSLILYDIYI